MMSVYFLLWGTIFPAMGRELLPLDGLWELSLPFKQEKVAVVPGTAFGACGEGFLRISYAYSIDSLKIALERIERFVKQLKNS